MNPERTLRSARREVEEWSTPDGRYAVACARTGRSPEPVDGARFASPADADRAAEAARRYHETLTTLDPDRPTYRFIVYETGGTSLSISRTREITSERRDNGVPRTTAEVTISSERDGEWLRLEDSPVVHLSRRSEPFDDDVVARQLERLF